MGHLEDLSEACGDAVAFLMVYIREAHAEDEWSMRENAVEGIAFMQPETLRERRQIAAAFAARLDVAFPIAVDGVDDVVGKTFGAWPERLYVIDPAGNVAYQGGYGPRDFEPDEVRAFLATEYGFDLSARP